MKFVLIDTCSFIDLLTLEEENHSLYYLKSWIENNYIKLIVPEKVLEEWNKHKEKKRKHFDDNEKTKVKHAKEVLKKRKLQIPVNIEPDITTILNQIKDIDSLISSAINIGTELKIKAYASDRQIARKAPFHIKIDSTKDAYIIFSTLDYCLTKNIAELLFISSNKSDFADPSNLTRKIHPEILENYKSVSVDYYSEIGRAISDLKNIFPIPLSSPKVREENFNELDKSKYPVQWKNKTNTLNNLETWYDFICTRNKELNSIPVQMLKKSYPFATNSDSNLNYELFYLTTDNEELVDFFNSIKVEKDGSILFTNKAYIKGVKDYENKTKEILRTLSNSVVFKLVTRRKNLEANIYYTDNVKCDCVSCLLERFDFKNLLSKLNGKLSSDEDKLQVAYTYYQLGFFVKADEVLQEVILDSEKKDEKIKQYIAYHNSYYLKRFLKSHSWNEVGIDKIIERLDKIDINKINTQLKTKDNSEVLDWINKLDFFKKSKDQICKYFSKIRDHYYLQLKGGWSTANDIWGLINEFVRLETFLNRNFIIYDGFSEFTELTDYFIEGVFASLAMNDSQPNKLKQLDDWMVSRIIFYGQPDRIVRYFTRYQLNDITYKKTSNNGGSLYEITERLLENSINIKTSLKKVSNSQNRYFEGRYINFLNNSIVLLSFVDITNWQVKNTSEKLLEFISKGEIGSPLILKYVRYFLIRKSNQLNQNILKTFLLDISYKNKFQKEELIMTIVEVIRKKYVVMNFTIKEYESFYEVVTENDDENKRIDGAILLVYFYEIVKNSNIRNRIKDEVVNILNDNFSVRLYYNSAFYGILNPKGKFFDKYLASIKPNIKTPTFVQAFTGRPSNRFDSVNDLINLCYKYDIDLKDRRFDRFRELNNYYEWLFNLEEFDYKLFNPSWIMEYPTIYYSKEFNKYPIIKRKVVEYLKKNKDPQLEKEFLRGFCLS